MDARLDQNETELGVLVLAIALEMLADGDGLRDGGEYDDAGEQWWCRMCVWNYLLDEHVQVLWDLGSEA